MKRNLTAVLCAAATAIAGVLAWVAFASAASGPPELAVFGDKTVVLVPLLIIVPAGSLAGILASERLIWQAHTRLVACGMCFIGALVSPLLVVWLMDRFDAKMAFGAPIVVPVVAVAGYRLGESLSRKPQLTR